MLCFIHRCSIFLVRSVAALALTNDVRASTKNREASVNADAADTAASRISKGAIRQVFSRPATSTKLNYVEYTCSTSD